MESVNPKNFIDIDPSIVSFVTLKDGNMIMVDDSTPAKPNKVKLFSNEEKNNLEPQNKEKTQELSLSEQINFSFIGSGSLKNEEYKTIIKKNDFNLISSISNNINFSFLNDNKINAPKNNININNNNKNNYKSNLANLASPNSSIDIKSSMFQGGKNNNINHLNNNIIISEDNVNIHLTDTYTSNPTNHYNGRNEEIMSKNFFSENNKNINSKNNKLRQVNKIIKDTQKYTFDEDPNNENDNNNGNLNNYNYKTEKNEKPSNYNNPSLVIQNNNFYSQNNFPNNNNMSEQNKTDNREVVMSNTTQDNKSTSTKKYSRLNRLRKKNKDNNYIKAVVSINIPAEEKETINLVKQFNSLVDRLNGQKSKTKAKEIIKKSERYYELYKKPNENIINSFISPEKNNINKKYNYFFDNINNKKKYAENNNNSIYSNENSNNTNNKNYNLNSRIMALKERTFSSMNSSFLNDNIKENYKSNGNTSEIVLPANFAFNN